MTESQWRTLSPIVEESCTGLFTSYGAPVAYAAECPGLSMYGQCMAAFIGFTSPQMRGSLLLATSLGMVQMSHPIDPRQIRDPAADLQEWTGELANQLLGRIKNKLVPYGLALQLTPPVCMINREIRAVPTHTEEARVYQFKGMGMDLFVRLGVTLAPGFTLTLAPDQGPVTLAPTEGEKMLF
jgi:hypothetical protein